MILEAVTCPDCGELSVRSIHIDERGAPFWACKKCGVIHEDRSWYRYIGQKQALAIIETRKPIGKFVLDTGIEVIGIDDADPLDVKVIVNDSGIEGGCGRTISYLEFMEAWLPSGGFMVSAFPDDQQ